MGIVGVLLSEDVVADAEGFHPFLERFFVIAGAGVIAGLVGKVLGVGGTLFPFYGCGDVECLCAPFQGFFEVTGVGEVFRETVDGMGVSEGFGTFLGGA